MDRSTFIKNSTLASAGILLAKSPLTAFANKPAAKKRIVMVGTGHRGIGFWGKPVVDNYGDVVEFVGLCDNNPGRLAFAKDRMGVTCPTFTDFTTMMRTVKPEVVIVTTVDSTHDEFIIKAMEMGADVITEKPMTTDEKKCKAILAAEKRTGKKVMVAFNYRHGPHMMKIKELLAANRIGNVTSVDFNWMLNVYHGADYFRRWHGLMRKSGSLWVHKSTHHFDLVNWWLNSEPVEVTAYGELEHYGKNNPFRGVRCQGCGHKDYCKFYRDITKEDWLNNLYVKNEHHDGYFRDQCVWRKEIDIYDKMSAQIKYANGVTVNYSLTTYSPYEGWRIAFNGFNGRMETWQDIPYQDDNALNQEQRHAVEMSQDKEAIPGKFREIMVMDNFNKEHEIIKVPQYAGGHGGGDKRMHNRIFRDPSDNPYNILAGTRDGAMSILIGIAANKSIQLKRPVKISELTDLKPMAKRHA
ncbi:Gfo/Idh/MocA family oxidoreductase [Aridibaculum aurantiacum]|uniref:Gfo/Idh/MocA family oxidoreductase n=1 Tax=Aridibaculum aurantiacum TaxID=2810307 RepID=UPI001A97BA9C|nr:Gfo/Idh/MocA family oxidoreductase [Aridibaculum aurantiacum]